MKLKTIDSTKESIMEGDDVNLWKRGFDYHTMFSTYESWELVRVIHQTCVWVQVVWFSRATPKYSFITWLVMHNRLITTDLMVRWNMVIPTQCVLCNNLAETRNHLFFPCEFSYWIWCRAQVVWFSQATPK